MALNNKIINVQKKLEMSGYDTKSWIQQDINVAKKDINKQI